jgi:hypothetical protein
MVAESEYADFLEELFVDTFGAENVSREIHHSDTDRVCDFLIETKLGRRAVEVENTSGDVVSNGAAQALLYSRLFDATPVVVYPPDGENDLELELLSSFIEIVPIEPYDWLGR